MQHKRRDTRRGNDSVLGNFFTEKSGIKKKRRENPGASANLLVFILVPQSARVLIGCIPVPHHDSRNCDWTYVFPTLIKIAVPDHVRS